MLKARAAVVAAVVVVPGLAIASLSELGVIRVNEVFRSNKATATITSPTSVVRSSGGVSPAGASHGALTVGAMVNAAETQDAIALAAGRKRLSTLGQRAAQPAQDPFASIVALTFGEAQAESIDQGVESLGVDLDSERVNLTKDVAVEASADEAQDSAFTEAQSISADSEAAAGFLPSDQSIVDALIPGLAQYLRAAGAQQGVVQGAQAPLVDRVASNNAGFAGTDTSNSSRSNAGVDTVVSFDESIEEPQAGESILASVIPAPGATASMGLLALAGLRRRRLA